MWAYVLVRKKKGGRGKPELSEISEEDGMMGQQAPVWPEWVLMELWSAAVEDLLSKSGWLKVQSISSMSRLSYLQNT